MKNLSDLFAALRQPHHVQEDMPTESGACLSCAADLRLSDAFARLRVCGSCGFHYTFSARERIAALTDPGSFRESNRSLISLDPISFSREYKQRLVQDERRTGLADAIVTGSARIGGRGVVLAVFDFRFMGGTIGSVVGEKLTQAMETAARRHKPLIAVVTSSGARMQEGPLALLQSARLTMARRRMAEARAPFLAVLGNPVLGAAYTAVAAHADFLIIEPDATIGYAAVKRHLGNGVVPVAGTLMQRGLVDDVVDRRQQRDLLAQVVESLTERTRLASQGDGTEAAGPAGERVAWHNVQLARHEHRPMALDFIGRIASTFVELRGDRQGSNAGQVICGVATIEGEAVMIVGQQRTPHAGNEGGEACLGPEAFRKAERAFGIAGRFGLPIITLIDTAGADPSVDAMLRGLGPAIAACTDALARSQAPTVAAIIGEGGSEAAVAFGVADRVLMMENATYAVTTPERAASILLRDPARAEEMSQALHLTAQDCKELKVVDLVVPEPAGGAHTDHDGAARALRSAILGALAELQREPVRRLLRDRYRRYRDIGEYSNYIGTALAHDVRELGAALSRRAGAAALRIRHPRRRAAASQPGEDGEPAIP